MLSRTLKMAFWVMYDHIGKLLLANLVWSLTLLILLIAAGTAFKTGDPSLLLMIGASALVLAFGVVLPVTTAGLAHMAKELIDTRDGSLGDLFRGMRLYGLRAVAIGMIYVVATVCLTVSVWFYATQLRTSAPWLGYALSALALWGLIFLAFTAMLVMPALVQKKGTVRETLKLAALLVLGNPLFCAGLALQFLVLAAVSLIPPVFLFLSGSMAAVLASSAYEMLARKYAAQSGAIDFHDETDDYLNRGLRDFLFPWKG